MKKLILILFFALPIFVSAQSKDGLYLGLVQKTSVTTNDTIVIKQEIRLSGSFVNRGSLYAVFDTREFVNDTLQVEWIPYSPIPVYPLDTILNKSVLQYYDEVMNTGDTTKWKYWGTFVYNKALQRNQIR